MSDPGFDPRLKAAMSEIQEVLQRYDIGAAVALVSPTHSEYAYELPSWSVLRWEDPGDGQVGLRLRSKREDFATRESQRAVTDATVHLVEQLRLIGGQTFEMFHQVMELCEQQFDITRTPRRHRPGQPDDAAFAQRFRQPRRPGQGRRGP
jgi:hypothetical protein